MRRPARPIAEIYCAYLSTRFSSKLVTVIRRQVRRSARPFRTVIQHVSFVYVNSFHHCESTCGAQAVAFEGLASRYKTVVNNEAPKRKSVGAAGRGRAALSQSVPYEKFQDAKEDKGGLEWLG